MSDDKKDSYEEEQERSRYQELYKFETKLDCLEKRLEVLHLLQQARVCMQRLRSSDLRLTRSEHELLDNSIKTLSKILN